jgi:hypothetical protein
MESQSEKLRVLQCLFVKGGRPQMRRRPGASHRPSSDDKGAHENALHNDDEEEALGEDIGNEVEARLKTHR